MSTSQPTKSKPSSRGATRPRYADDPQYAAVSEAYDGFERWLLSVKDDVVAFLMQRVGGRDALDTPA